MLKKNIVESARARATRPTSSRIAITRSRFVLCGIWRFLLAGWWTLGGSLIDANNRRHFAQFLFGHPRTVADARPVIFTSADWTIFHWDPPACEDPAADEAARH